MIIGAITEPTEERHAAQLVAVLIDEGGNISPLVIFHCACVGDVVSEALNASRLRARCHPVLIDELDAIKVSERAISLSRE